MEHVKKFFVTATHIWKKSQHDFIFTQATALAYTTLLSLVPILAVAFFIFNAYGGFHTLLDKIQPLIEENLAPSFGSTISQYLNGFLEHVHAGAVGTLGAIGFIFTSISTLATIEKTFNLIWGVRRSRSWGQRLTAYWSLLTIGPLLLGISLLLSSNALTWLKADHGAVSGVLVWTLTIAPYFFSGFLFSCLFLFMPNTSVDKYDAVKAGFITGIVFEGAKLFYANYAVRTLSNNSLYGSLAVFPVFLLWLYVVWLIVLFGAELCCYLQFRRLKIPFRFDAKDRINSFLIMDILEELGIKHEPRGGLNVAQLLALFKVPLHELAAHLDFLEGEGIIVVSSGDFMSGKKYHLSLPREKINVRELLMDSESRRYVPRSPKALKVHQKFKSLWEDWAHDGGKK